MTIDEIVSLLKASLPNALSPLQELILRDSWEGKTYTSMAFDAHYGEERVRKVASHLWQILTSSWKEPINKSNFRQTLEFRRLGKAEQGVIKQFNRAKSAISLEFPNGPVSLDSRFYIPRPPIEELVYAEIAKPGSVICLQGAKKMGKSSLILRIIAHAEYLGYQTVSLDFQQAERAVFANFDKFLRWVCANLTRELGLELKLNEYWDEDMGSKVSCSLYFQNYLLECLEKPLVLVFNEVDWVFEYPEIAGDFFLLLRSWYEQAKRIEMWEKLRLVLAYSTEILVGLKLTQSPFNIGLPIKLPRFTLEQVQNLAQCYGLSWASGVEASKLMNMVGGHPYLVRLALYHLLSKGGLERDLEELLQQAPTEAGIYKEFLRQYVLLLQEQPELTVPFASVINSHTYVKLEPRLAYKLQSMELINVEGDRCTVANELYRLYFQQLYSKQDSSDVRIQQLTIENQQLRGYSYLDELTELGNCRYFHTYLQIEWQRSARLCTSLSMILCDIDYFRIYNRNYGNKAGDECLRKIANAIRMSVDCCIGESSFSYAQVSASTTCWHESNSVLLARYGGEEFAILSQTDIMTTMYMAEKIRLRVKDLAIECDYPGMGGLPDAVLTVSLGVASVIPQAEDDANNLVNTAHKALGQAKRRGRDRVILG